MKEFKDIKDDQIRVIGEEDNKTTLLQWRWIILIAAVVLAVVVILAVTLHRNAPPGTEQEQIINNEQIQDREPAQDQELTYFEPVEPSPPATHGWIGRRVGPDEKGFTEIRDTVINDISLRLYLPHNATMSLHVGAMDRRDSSVIYAAQAADIRADNGGIVGAFVLKGKPLAWGLSKMGFCASIDGKVTIGVAKNSPLFEEATEKGGYFFRQYPLVGDGQLVENAPKGKSIRRGICDRQGEIFMVETATPESFHDFSQALVDLGVDQAIYLVGSTAYGWATDCEGVRHEFGNDAYYTRNIRMPRNTSYIVWKRE